MLFVIHYLFAKSKDYHYEQIDVREYQREITNNGHIDVREYQRETTKNGQHWVHKTKTNKTKTQHNICWAPLYANKHK
jgi:hypothetical protein